MVTENAIATMNTENAIGYQNAIEVPSPKRRPFYMGGKAQTGVYHTIINQIPPHDIFYELFAGNAAISRHLRFAKGRLLMEKNLDQCQILKEEFYTGLGIGRTTVKQGDALEYLKKMVSLSIDEETSCIYLDPPYPLDTRRGADRYECELSDSDHAQLLWLVKQFTRTKILISTYPNDMYATALADWRLVEFEARDRAGNTRTEWLFCNFPEPTELHDYRYVGDTFRDRERIQRLQRSWIKKLHKLQPLERKAMLATLKAEFPEC